MAAASSCRNSQMRTAVIPVAHSCTTLCPQRNEPDCLQRPASSHKHQSSMLMWHYLQQSIAGYGPSTGPVSAHTHSGGRTHHRAPSLTANTKRQQTCRHNSRSNRWSVGARVPAAHMLLLHAVQPHAQQSVAGVFVSSTGQHGLCLSAPRSTGPAG